MFFSRVLLFSFLVALSRAEDAIESDVKDAQPAIKEVEDDHAPSESRRVARQFAPEMYPPAAYPQEVAYMGYEGVQPGSYNARSFFPKPTHAAPSINILPVAATPHVAHTPVIPTVTNCEAQQPVPVTTYTPVKHTSYVPVQHTAYVPVQQTAYMPVQQTAYKPTTYYAQPPPAVHTYSAPPAHGVEAYAGAHAGAFAAPIVHSGLTTHQAHPGLPCLQNLGHPLFQKSSQVENPALYYSKHLVINNPKADILASDNPEIQIRDAVGNEEDRINLDAAASQQQISASQFQPYQHQYSQRESPVESSNYVR